MPRWVLGVGAVAAVLWLRTAAFPVDYAEFALVTRFGRPVAAIDGATDAGLHVKLPWPADAVRTVDRRVQLADLPAVEAVTRDAAGPTVDKTVTVSACVTWRVPDAAAADRFVRAVGSVDQAHRVLAPRLAGRLAAAVAARPLDALVAVADAPAVAARADDLRRAVLGDDGPDPLRPAVRADYGIELIDVRVRRLGFPDAVRDGIADRIRSERRRKAAEYETDGQRRAADILSQADKDARLVEADARFRQRAVEGQADADADRARAEAFAADREFFEFLEKLKAYRAMLADTRDVLLLSTKHPLFDLLLNPPKAAP